MLARDHAVTAAAGMAGLDLVLRPHPPTLIVGLVIAAGAGTLPDIDEPGSTVARANGWLTEAAAWIVHRVSGGHRHGTHSLVGAAVVAGLVWLAWRYDHTRAGMVGLTALLAVLLAAAARVAAPRRRGHRHLLDTAATAAAAALVATHAELAVTPIAVAVGVCGHIAGDMATHGGCPLLWPASPREYHFLPRPWRFSTGRAAEHWIVTPALLTVFGLLLAADLGWRP